MATVVHPVLITIYQIKGLTLWWDVEECKEGPAYLFQMQLHLLEHECDLQVSGFFKKKKDSPSWYISEVPNPIVILWWFQGYNHKQGRLCQWDRCYPWKSFLILWGSIWAFFITKWWQIKDDSICSFHEHLNWVLHKKNMHGNTYLYWRPACTW